MKRKKILLALETAWNEEKLVYIKRRFDSEWERGFVVGLSDDWFLMQYLNRNTMRLDGYCALRVKDVEEVSEATDFANLALRLRKESPTPQPDILVLDLPGLLSSIDAHRPPVRVYQEDKEAPAYIGRLLRITEKSVILRIIDRSGRFLEEPHRIKRKHITQIEFGDGYTTELWNVVEYRRNRNGRPSEENE